MHSDKERKECVSKFMENVPFYTYYSLLSIEEGTVHETIDPLPNEILICNMTGCVNYKSVDIGSHGIILF